MKGNKVFILYLVILVILSSCKSKQKIIKTGTERNVDITFLMNAIEEGKQHIRTLRFSKVKFSIEMNEEEYKTGGTIGIIKDSILVVSIVPVMGYEVARLYCTKDSIIVINRNEKAYYRTSTGEELKKYHISADYTILQSILMNSYFVYNENAPGRFYENSMVLQEGNYLIKSEEKIGDELYFEQEQVVDALHLGIKSISIHDYLHKETIQIDCDLFRKYGDVYLPEKIVLNSDIGDFSVHLEMEIGNIEVNDVINATVKIPAKYRKITH